MSTVIVLATAIFFICYGLLFVASPDQFSLLITQSAPQSISGLVDFRATYGGMSIAVGVILTLTTRSPEFHRLGLVSVVITMLAMAAGRTIGIAIDGAPNRLMYIYLIAELVTAGIAGYALSSRSKVVMED